MSEQTTQRRVVRGMCNHYDYVFQGTQKICLIPVPEVETPERAKYIAEIIALPELLAACEKSLSWLSSYQGGGALEMYDEMRAALEKAKRGAV